MTRFLLLPFSLCFALACSAQSSWTQYADPAQAGFDAKALEQVRLRADELQSGAMMIVQDGRVVAAWGDVQRKFGLHSVRKSLVSALLGIEVEAGRMARTATLADMGIDDSINPLTDVELSATLQDLISARSGVFLPAAYAPSSQDDTRPERGAHEPGEHFFYNNWDFNVAGVIYESLIGEKLYRAFDERIAHPLGMEDYHPRDGLRVYAPSKSQHPAHTFRMSTRDLARFGVLYANGGLWKGTEIVPAEWVAESTAPHSDFQNARGYGYMWWTYEAGHLNDRSRKADVSRAYLAQGTGGQAVLVYQDLGLVIVHRGDTDHDRHVAGGDIWEMFDGIMAARTGNAQSNPDLIPFMGAVPFDSQLPDDRTKLVHLTAEEVDAFVGTFRAENGMQIAVFEFEGGAYMDMPGRGQAQLFRVPGEVEYTIQVMQGVKILTENGAQDRIEKITVSMGPMTIRAARVN